MPNLTATMLCGAPVENIAITSAPRAHEQLPAYLQVGVLPDDVMPSWLLFSPQSYNHLVFCLNWNNGGNIHCMYIDYDAL